MESAKGLIVLLVLSSFHLCNPASLHPLGQTLPMVHLQAKTECKGEQKFLNSAKSDGSIIPHHGRKLLHAMGGGGVTGGQVAGGGGYGNGDGSHSNYPKGGGAVPVYAAGAANAHHKSHRGAGNCIHHSQGSSKFTTVLLTYLLLTNPFGF